MVQSDTELAEAPIDHPRSLRAATHTPTPWRLAGKGTVRAGKDSWIGTLRWHNRDGNAAYLLEAVNNYDALVQALSDTLCELTACANQLSARGLKGHEGDSVSRAQAAARAVLSKVKT